MAVIVGCEKPPPEPARVPAASVTGTGVVTGRVTFDGPVPDPKIVRNTPCCPDAPPTLLDETVVLGTGGGLANVFVYLEGGPLADGVALPPALLDQKFCQYVPHAIGVVVGQTLKVRSSDPTFHNVNIRPESEDAQNFSMKAAGETSTTHFDRPGFATSKCDVHSWMNATIGVFDNPFFAVTAGDGTFTISGVPDGTYTLVAQHERYLSLRQPLTISGGKPATADFRYHPPTP